MWRTSLIFPVVLTLIIGCDADPIGAPCESDADCSEGLFCDVHGGGGTCQEGHGHTSESEGGETHGETHGDTEEEGACEGETRADEFALGLSKTGASITATFVSADPAPPIKGDNSWVLTFTDEADAPLDGLEIVVTPMMPDHGHGTPVEVVVSATGNPGEYSLSPVNLFMTGYWETTLDITLDQEQDAVTFGFCVE